MTLHHYQAATLFVCLAAVAPRASAQATTPCPLRGGAVERARCLLRPVLPFGRLGAPLAALPAPLDTLVGNEAQFPRGRLAALLRAERLGPRALGGVATRRLPARVVYFVIHDTSSPAYGAKPFPTGIDSARWSGNRLARWRRDRGAHVYVMRTGASVAARTFEVRWRATKREKRERRALFGRMLHVELVQPRRSAPIGPAGNDAMAPSIAFTGPQIDRLALLYVVASARRGRWLVPAFHAALDAGIRGAHDDPQGFDLAFFASRVAEIVRRLEAQP